jgi:hypothetical protein
LDRVALAAHQEPGNLPQPLGPEIHHPGVKGGSEVVAHADEKAIEAVAAAGQLGHP